MHTTVHQLTAITFCNGFWFAILEFTVYSRSAPSPPPGLTMGRFFLVRAFTGPYRATPFKTVDAARRSVDQLADVAVRSELCLPESEWHLDTDTCVPPQFGPRERSRTDPTEAWLDITMLGPSGVFASPSDIDSPAG